MNANRAKIQARLKWLAKNGEITPEQVVEDARPVDSPLHPYFEWNDSLAAHNWRIEQARRLLQSFELVTHVGGVSIITPNFVRDPQKQVHEQGYIDVAQIRTKEEIAVDLMHEEMERIAALVVRGVRLSKVTGKLEKEFSVLENQVNKILFKLRNAA